MMTEKRSFNPIKLVTWVVLVLAVGACLVYLATIRQQVFFTIIAPNAVSACMEGYQGEHGEADKRFMLKQRSELLSPLSEEGLKGLSQ